MLRPGSLTGTSLGCRNVVDSEVVSLVGRHLFLAAAVDEHDGERLVVIEDSCGGLDAEQVVAGAFHFERLLHLALVRDLHVRLLLLLRLSAELDLKTRDEVSVGRICLLCQLALWKCIVFSQPFSESSECFSRDAKILRTDWFQND